MAKAGGESSEHFVAVAVLIGEFFSLFCLLLCIYCAMNEFECVCVCWICLCRALSMLEPSLMILD